MACYRPDMHDRSLDTMSREYHICRYHCHSLQWLGHCFFSSMHDTSLRHGHIPTCDIRTNFTVANIFEHETWREEASISTASILHEMPKPQSEGMISRLRETISKANKISVRSHEALFGLLHARTSQGMRIYRWGRQRLRSHPTIIRAPQITAREPTIEGSIASCSSPAFG